MTKLKIFNDSGIDEFRNYLVQLKNNAALDRIDLNEARYCENFLMGITVEENKIFSSRMELGEYLTEIFTDAGIKTTDVIANNKLWTWLTYLWFDQICPLMDGQRKVMATDRYICNSHPFRYYRHYVASTYSIYTTLGKENSLLFLNRAINAHGEFIEQLASRQEIISRPNLIKVAHELYWDKINNKSKPGALDKNKQGVLRRLIKLFGQIELTFDIFSMKPEKIISLFPKEFNKWKLN